MNKKIGMGTATGVLIIVAAFIVMFVASYKQTRDQNENVGNSAPVTVNTPSDSKSKPSLAADETANWKTYNNDELGFEIKYPNGWRSKENSGVNYDRSVVSIASPATQKLVEDYEKREGKTYPYQDDISIYYYPSIAEEPSNKLGHWGATTLDELISKDLTISKIGSTELGGISAIDVIYGGESAYYTVLSVKDSHLYKVWFNKRDSKDKLTAEEKQILSTFKFTDQTSSVDTSDWKTYEGNASGLRYKIKHPQDWTAVEASRTMAGLRAPGTKPQAGDFTADVYISLQDSSVEKITNSIGSQFSDRKAVSENITIGNNVSATKLTVSSPSNPEWISHSLLIKVDSQTFNISDGAGDTPNFWSIASTFEIIK